MRIDKSNYSEQTTPVFKFFSDDQIYEIHLASLEVLERVGVRVDNEEALKLLKDAGAYIYENNIVKIPAFLIKEALQSAPPRVVLSTRDGERKLFLERNQVYYGAGSDLPWFIDMDTGELRKSTKQYVADVSRVMDALPNYDFVMSYGIATDVHSQLSYLHQFHAMVENTKKPIVFTARDGEDLLQIIEMAAAIRGGLGALRENPFIALYHEPISPLWHPDESLQKLLVCARYGIPAIYTPGAGAGATAPCTLAGLLTQINAELLSGLVIHQLKAKGAPFIYGGACTSTDMKTTILPHGAPEFHMLGAMIAQLSRFYELPSWSTAGNSDAVIPDQQAGIEWGFSILLGQLSGANLVHDVGYLATGLIGSVDSLVMCNEIVGMVRHVGRGITVNKETLAVEVIERVGPSGNYFMDEHTFEHYKKEFWVPELINRYRYENWKDKGKLTLGDKAKAKAKKILESYRPDPLATDLKEKLAEIMARAEAEAEKKEGFN